MAAMENKVAIITGSGGGIGGAIALRYAREGAKLALADIVAETAKVAPAKLILWVVTHLPSPRM